MKKLIFFVLLIVISLVSFSQNMIVNPGFETWEVSHKPNGWTTAQNCLKDSVQIKSGTYSCRHEGTTGATKYLGQTLPVGPGKSYSISFFYKTATTGTGNGCRLWCYWKDNNGDNFSDPVTDAVLRPSKYLKSDTWQQLSINIIAPAEAAAFYLEVRTYPNSIVYWDDFIFEETVATWNNERTASCLEFYPNPSSDYLIINNLNNIQYINIQSLAGTIIWSSGYSGEQCVTIPVAGFADGIYILRVFSSGKLITRKFIKKAN